MIYKMKKTREKMFCKAVQLQEMKADEAKQRKQERESIVLRS